MLCVFPALYEVLLPSGASSPMRPEAQAGLRKLLRSATPKQVFLVILHASVTPTDAPKRKHASRGPTANCRRSQLSSHPRGLLRQLPAAFGAILPIEESRRLSRHPEPFEPHFGRLNPVVSHLPADPTTRTKGRPDRLGSASEAFEGDSGAWAGTRKAFCVDFEGFQRGFKGSQLLGWGRDQHACSRMGVLRAI